jgi:hypothetical protein
MNFNKIGTGVKHQKARPHLLRPPDISQNSNRSHYRISTKIRY